MRQIHSVVQIIHRPQKKWQGPAFCAPTRMFYLGKIWKNMGKRPFFRAATAGLGKYGTGGCGRIGVYRVKVIDRSSS